jgi:hypothetical protein
MSYLYGLNPERLRNLGSLKEVRRRTVPEIKGYKGILPPNGKRKYRSSQKDGKTSSWKRDEEYRLTVEAEARLKGIYKDSVRTSKRKPNFIITNINWLTLFTEINRCLL